MQRIKEKIKPILKNIFFLMVVCIFLILLFEIGARLTYPFYSDYNTEMWRYAKELKKSSNNPLLSHEHIPNSEASLYGTHIKINSDGFRDYEHLIKKEDNTFRILAVGDSITLGWSVKFDNIFTKLLEKKLNNEKPFKDYKNYEVINTGIGNYNTLMELVILKEKCLKYNPDLILLEYYINDAEVIPKKPFILLKYFYSYAFLWAKFQNIKAQFIKGYDYETYYKNLYKEGSIGRKDAKNALLEIISISKEKNIPLVIVIFPEFHNFKDYQFSEVTDFVFEVADSQKDVYILDLLPFYQDYQPESVWVSFEDAHPNDLGNKIAAEAIYQMLINQKLMDQ